jgi:hypothetical protein
MDPMVRLYDYPNLHNLLRSLTKGASAGCLALLGALAVQGK